MWRSNPTWGAPRIQAELRKLGIDVSDRVWTCVALCPNCHREAHFSPDRDAINAQLRDFAAQFA